MSVSTPETRDPKLEDSTLDAGVASSRCGASGKRAVAPYHQSAMDDKVLDYGDCLLRVRDVALLTGPHWLNDAIMNFYFEFLRREGAQADEPHDGEVALVDASVSFLVANVSPDEARAILEPLGVRRAKLALFLVRQKPPRVVPLPRLPRELLKKTSSQRARRSLPARFPARTFPGQRQRRARPHRWRFALESPGVFASLEVFRASRQLPRSQRRAREAFSGDGLAIVRPNV